MQYFSVTIRKLRVNVPAILKNEELTGLSYWKNQLPVSQFRACIFHLSLPALLGVHFFSSRGLRTKPKLDSCKAFQAVECASKI